MHRRGSESVFSLSLLLLLLLPWSRLTFVVGAVNSARPDYGKLLENERIEEKLRLLSPESLLRNHREVRAGLAVNRSCARDLEIWERAVGRRESWALKMQDASSKIPAGLLQGNLVDMGIYAECAEARGRHCMYSISPALLKHAYLLTPTLTICLPASCTANDVARLVNRTIDAHAALGARGITVATVTCSTVDSKESSAKFKFWTTLLTIYTTLLVLCTLCDLTNRHSVVVGPGWLTLARFSLLKNGESILSTEPREGDLSVIHGIRVLSTAWIVLVHEYFVQFYAVNVNVLDIEKWFSSWMSLFPLIGLHSVDTFFTLSGFLMAYTFFKQRQKNKPFNIFRYYLHRFVRLTFPVVMFLVFTYVFVSGSGPRYEWIGDIFKNGIQSKWWSIILYVQNFVERDNYCTFHLWSLAVDMQLFWISPLILYPLYRSPKIGLAILGSLFLASIITTAAIVGLNKYSAIHFTQTLNVRHFLESVKDVYVMPYTRASPWLLGIFFGYELTCNNRKSNKMILCAGWLLAFIAVAFCILGTKSFTEESYVYSPVWEIIFAALARPAWAFAVCWIIYASTHDFAGPISSILKWKYFLPLSKISYSIYLVHLVFPMMEVSISRSSRYFHEYYIFQSYISNVGIAIIASFFYSLIFEVPMIILEDIIFRRKSKSALNGIKKVE